MENETIHIGIVDDHLMMRKALAGLVHEFEGCRVVLEAGNGIELQSKLKKGIEPDIIILDLQMPLMDGFETLDWLQKNYPSIKVIILTMCDSDFSSIRLLRAGAKAFLRKTMLSEELNNAICSVNSKGFYYTNSITRKLLNTLYNDLDPDFSVKNYMLTKKEIQFLEFSTTDLTYKEVAMEMNISFRAVDKIRDRLFFKLEVKSRVGLAMKAVNNGMVVKSLQPA